MDDATFYRESTKGNLNTKNEGNVESDEYMRTKGGIEEIEDIEDIEKMKDTENSEGNEYKENNKNTECRGDVEDKEKTINTKNIKNITSIKNTKNVTNNPLDVYKRQIRSSPRSMASTCTPITLTLYLSRTPALLSSEHKFNPDWPPRLGSKASGRSLAMICSKRSTFSGSM